MATAAAVIAIAQGEIGQGGQPPGSHYTKYGVWYGDPNGLWCAMFLSWCGDQAARAQTLAMRATTPVANPFGDTANPNGFAYTPTWADWFRQHQEFTAADAGIQTGDIVFFDKIGAGRISHVGIVTTATGGGYSTIEGDTYNAATGATDTVAAHTYTTGDTSFRGYGRPLYDGIANTPSGTPGNVPQTTPTYVAPPAQPLIPIRGLPSIQDGALTDIRVSGTRASTDLTGRVTKATFTFSSTEKSSLQLAIQDTPDAIYMAGGVFARDYQVEEFGQPVALDWGDQHMVVTAVDFTRGQGGPLITVTALSASVRYLTSWAHKGTTQFGTIAPADLIKNLAANAGARAIVQDGGVPGIPAGPITRQASQTSWDVMQQVAKAQGCVCFEHDNTIFYGQPSWLAAYATTRAWSIVWNRWDSYSAGIDGMPILQAALDDSNGDVLSFGLISADRWLARPGDTVDLGGAMTTANGRWLVDKVVMNLRVSQVVQVTCGRIIDPPPELPTSYLGYLPTINSPGGGVTVGAFGQTP